VAPGPRSAARVRGRLLDALPFLIGTLLLTPALFFLFPHHFCACTDRTLTQSTSSFVGRARACSPRGATRPAACVRPLPLRGAFFRRAQPRGARGGPWLPLPAPDCFSVRCAAARCLPARAARRRAPGTGAGCGWQPACLCRAAWALLTLAGIACSKTHVGDAPVRGTVTLSHSREWFDVRRRLTGAAAAAHRARCADGGAQSRGRRCKAVAHQQSPSMAVLCGCMRHQRWQHAHGKAALSAPRATSPVSALGSLAAAPS
jgi:hypothetical protein